MKRALIVIGSPIVNMGSQAIVRGLAKNIKKVDEDIFIEVMVTYLEGEKSLDIEGVDKLSNRYSIDRQHWNFLRILNRIQYQFTHKASLRLMMSNYLSAAKKADIVLIVGADNYDISYNSLAYMNETNKFVAEIGAEKFVLYNCSVSKEDLIPGVVQDLNRFKYLTARDSISFVNMKAALPKKDIRFFPDVAFCMDPQKTELPDGWDSGNMIGVNLSSLVADGRYGVTEDEILNAYRQMIDYILEKTDLKICFIPHVKKDADLSVLRKLNEYVNNPDRAIIINHENYNAAQKKYLISQCRMFVGARTHATIAAYSSLVPTLVVGYSIKSVGIATDLLGTDAGNVIPVQTLKKPDMLKTAFIGFMERESDIRDRLSKTVPPYIAAVTEVQDLVKEILSK